MASEDPVIRQELAQFSIEVMSLNINATIYAGTSEIQRKIIAERVLKLPR